jgi:hypothetical protein
MDEPREVRKTGIVAVFSSRPLRSQHFKPGERHLDSLVKGWLPFKPH